MLHLTQADYTVTRWAGGTTAQIAIAPSGATYGNRDFLWRISSAVVEDERSTFTRLPDYQRCLMLLEGALDLSHNGGGTIHLEPFQAHVFDGGADTASIGVCRDFNLMLRKGKCAGALRPVRFSKAGEDVLLPSESPGRLRLIYCANGGGTAAIGEETRALAQGESLLLEGDGALRLTVPAAADFILAEISSGSDI